MLVYAVYIIYDDGRPLVWQIFQTPDFLPPEGLISPLLTSIQGLSSDLLKQEGTAEKFTLGGLTYHMKWFGEYFVVLVMESEEKPTKALNQIGWQFLQEFKEDIDHWDGNVSKFNEFKGNLIEILQSNFSIDQSKSINPSKKLNTKALFNLDKNLKDTAIAIVGLKSATAEEVAKDSGEDLQVVETNLIKLQEMGYLGSKQKDGKLIFFF